MFDNVPVHHRRRIRDEVSDDVYWQLGAVRESAWLPSTIPPVVPGTYLTRSPRGLAIMEWRNRRWQGARAGEGPAEWKGIDVVLKDAERDLLRRRLYRGRYESGLPLMRDAFACYAGALAEKNRKEVLPRLKLVACRYFVMLSGDKQGKKLLTRADRSLMGPLINSLKPREQIVLEQSIGAFKNGVEL